MKNEYMPHWLRQRAALTPQRIAFETENELLTFRELDDHVRLLAIHLYELGVRTGAKVALLQENTVGYAMCYHALSYLGAVAVPLNVRLSVKEIIWQIEDCEAELLIHDRRHSEMATAIADQCRALHAYSIHTLGQPNKMHSSILLDEIDMDAVHTIIYTSGTTGRPKGVLLTHRNHWGSAIGSTLNLGLRPDDKWLSCVPLFHVSGLSILMRSVIYGMTVRLHKRFDPKQVNQAIMEQGITIISVVSAMLTEMVNALGDKQYPKQFRCMLLGGGPAPLPLLKQCESRDIPVYQTYGLSESASQIVTLSPEYMTTKIGSAGKPLFPAQIKIVDENSNQTGPCKEGEILVKGPNVTSGYYNRPEATERTIRDGWLHTGDVGYLDEEGFLYVIDRRKDMIVSGGENVYPAEVEAALLAHPDVEEAGVVGMKDEQWGRVPVAFVKVKAGSAITESDFQMFCRDQIAHYKVPKRVFFVEGLPRNASKKLLRRTLVDWLPENLR